jgi:hypothetical protein
MANIRGQAKKEIGFCKLSLYTYFLQNEANAIGLQYPGD